jgi:hypothetical protein
MSHRLKNPEIFKVIVAAAVRFTFFYYRRGAVAMFYLSSRRGSGAVAIFYFPSRRGSGRCSAAMDISG